MSAILSILTKFLLYRQIDLNEICSRSVGVKLNHLLIIQIKIGLSCLGVYLIKYQVKCYIAEGDLKITTSIIHDINLEEVEKETLLGITDSPVFSSSP